MNPMPPPGGTAMQRLWWTAGVVVGASLPHWTTLPLWVPLLLGSCVVWRLAAGMFGWRLPNSFVRIALALSAFVLVLLEFRTINGLAAGSALLVVMVALKFLESRTDRDQLVLIIIAYFLVFASLLSERNLLTGGYLIVFVYFTTVGLLQLGRSGPLLPWRTTLRLATRLLVPAIPIMLVLFLLFPRLPGPLWGMPGHSSSASSGLDEEMSPGDLTELGLSDDVAFRVEFFGRPPPPERLYWRGPVLSNFNGRTWTRDPGMRRRALDTLRFEGEPIDYRVMLEPHGKRWTFALDMPQEWEQSKSIYMNSDYQLIVRFADAIHSRFDYRVRSYPAYEAQEPLGQAERDVYLRLPPNSNPRSRALAEGWGRTTSDPREIIRQGLALFQQEQFFYTLTPPPLGSHPADDFLFTTREGFCEHYASAFAVLMRAAGIPTRIVTGYQGGELNPLGEYFIIRQSDAHAWTELWLEGEGWIRVDPTAAVAPERIALGSSESARRDAAKAQNFGALPWIRDVALLWDALNIQWQTWVLDYGPDGQYRLLESLGIDEPDWKKLAVVASIALAVLLLGLMLQLGWLYRRRAQHDPAARCFERFTRAVGRRIAPRGPTEGAVAFGIRAAASAPERAQDIERIVQTYLAARYEPDPDGSHMRALRRMVQGFRWPRR